MDIIPVFGTVVGGSNPSGSTKDKNICPSADFFAFVLGGALSSVSRDGEPGSRAF